MPEDRIASYELFQVAPRWQLLRVETDAGVVGWGEPVLEGQADAVAAAVHTMMEWLTGEDPARINFHWQRLAKGMFYGGRGLVMMSALSGIDQALWDIRGKTLGVPVTDLLGGHVRDRMRMYGWVVRDAEGPGPAAESALEAVERGFTVLKMNGGPKAGYFDFEGAIDEGVARLKAVTEAVGPGVRVGLDLHGRCKLPMARRWIRALEPFDPIFIEEPLHPDFNDALPDLANFTAVPLATGERMTSAAEFYELLRRPGVSIAQPDLSHAGGITGCRQIAQLSESRDVGFAPHCPLGPVALASCLAVDFVSLNAVFQECCLGVPYRGEGGADLWDLVGNRDDFALDGDGMIARPTKPGLGLEMDEAAVREVAKRGHRWRDNDWRLADGAPTRW